MITKKELSNAVLSPTKKDYYQIWAELLDLASRISDRWTPDETNESDPGIVLLKALTAIADKLNYNIDKNTLEAFMPSATQEESMRKLTEMMGYNMKYYQSATCKVRIDFQGTDDLNWQQFPSGIYFPKFTNLTNEDEDINYVTLESFKLYQEEPYRAIYAIEGEVITCESDSDNVVSIKHLDDNNKYFLPEVGIAENGIFVSNISDNIEEEQWEKVDNLNTNFAGSKVFKFGIDSASKLPYIQFPEDISHLIKRGLKIQYIRTSGLNGNTSAGNLTKLTPPAEWSNVAAEDDPVKSLTTDNFKVKQLTAGSSGANPESLNEAYNNYKKTIGTFDTLVTCRDYMNKIYQMTEPENNTTPLVSNIIVSDIRDDINKAITLCSFNDYGISYSNKSLKITGTNNDEIDHCDLILYPFKTIYGANDEREYNNSFKYDTSNNNIIENEINELKTISHKFKTPDSSDIVCIKNYLQLKAQVYTYKKVSTEEGKEILANIRTNLFKKFNARQLDFGEEIPYDTLVDEIINADTRIKDITLDEPVLITKICDRSNSEYVLASMSSDNSEEGIKVKKLYNKLVLRNVLAGRIAAFSYNNSFVHDYRDTNYSGFESGATTKTYEIEYGPGNDAGNNQGSYIKKVKSKFTVTNDLATEKDKGIKLKENQVIQFRMPNLKTAITYPAYVNYYYKLNTDTTSGNEPFYPATMQSLLTFIQTENLKENQNDNKFLNFLKANKSNLTPLELKLDAENATERSNIYKEWLATKQKEYGIVLIDNTTCSIATNSTSVIKGTNTFYILPFESSTLGLWNTWVTNTLERDGIYKNNGVDLTGTPGFLRDSLKQSYTKITTVNTQHNSSTLKNFYIPITHTADDSTNHTYTADGLGKDGKLSHTSINAEYQLQNGEYLLINYTDSSTDENNTEVKTVINKYYGAGTIIRPNFELVNSETYHTAGHSWSKKDGFNFTDCGDGNPEGMFTLGTNEQIEIREITKVKLDGTINLYWILNSDDLTAASNEFIFTEKYSDNDITNESNSNNAYTLKEGEYLLYTDQNKTDFAYYGAGSVIVKENINQIKRVSTETSKVSMSAVEQNWINSDIPWTTYTLTNNQAVYVIENQYISLTEGDTLNFASSEQKELASSVNTTLSIESDTIDDTWKAVKSAGWTFADGSTGKLPAINITNISWKVKSRLDFNMSAGNPQTLHAGDQITLVYVDSVGQELDSSCWQTLKPLNDKQLNDETSKIIPLTIQPNSLCLGTFEEIDVTESSEIIDGEIVEKLNKDFRVRVTKRDEIVTKDTSILNLNNYVNNDNFFTKYSFVGEPSVDSTYKKIVINNSGRYLIKIKNYSATSADTKEIFIGKKDDSTAKYNGKTIKLGDKTVSDTTNVALPIEDTSNTTLVPYYLFGNFTSWLDNNLFKFKTITGNSNEVFIELKLTSGDSFVIAEKQLKEPLNNFSLTGDDLDFYTETPNKDFELNTNIPTGCFGLVMFYWNFNDDAYIDHVDSSSTKIVAQAKLVANDSGLLKLNDQSTTTEIYGTTVNLQRGFNMIKVASSTKKITVYGTCGNIIFDNLKVVENINPLLEYQLWDTSITGDDDKKCLNQLLADIKNYGDVTKDFYYNAPVLANTAIELNPLVENDTLLKNPLNWYDINNINNKFVISELDTEYLKTGITIARASRR